MKFLIVFLIFILFSFSIFYFIFFDKKAPFLDMYFMNLEKGYSVLLYTPNGQTILINGGSNTEVLQEITKILPFRKRYIDAVVMTNSLDKNIGGLIDVMKRYEVGRIISPEIISTSTTLSILEREINKKGLKIERVKKGDIFEIDKITFKVLFPDPDFAYNRTSLSELVLEISHNSDKVILLGDVSRTIQKSLISSLDSGSVVFYSHSAINSRIYESLIDKLSPDFVIIKKKNRSSSKKSYIELLKNIEVINLENHGTAHFVFDLNKIILK